MRSAAFSASDFDAFKLCEPLDFRLRFFEFSLELLEPFHQWVIQRIVLKLVLRIFYGCVSFRFGRFDGCFDITAPSLGRPIYAMGRFSLIHL
jgi:hypothetical protein